MITGSETPTDGLGATAAPAGSSEAQPVVAEATPSNETDEQANELGATEGDEPAVEANEEKPKRLSGYQKEKMRRLRSDQEKADLAYQLAEVRAKLRQQEEKEPDYSSLPDWDSQIAARTAYQVGKAVDEKLSAREQAELKARAEDLRKQADEALEERLAEAREKIPDFDEVLRGYGAKHGQFSEAVHSLLVDSEKGPEMAYFLAKNPAVALKLNSLSERDAAKAFGVYEDRLSSTQKKPTSAPPVQRQLTGGAQPPVDERALAKSDDATALIDHWRKKASA